MTLRALLIDDDHRMAELLSSYFEPHGVELVHAADGSSGLAKVEQEGFDVVLLDLTMPGMDGLEVCRRIRKRHSVPIVMLTARGDETDRVVGLELGADDYLPKPFSLRELLARVRAVLRRPGPRQKGEELAFGDVRVRSRGRQVFKAGHEVMLTRKEFDLLLYLLAHRGEVITRERLLDEVWGYERFPTTRTVDTHVLRLRRKFEADPEHPRFILTVHGQGYRFAGY